MTEEQQAALRQQMAERFGPDKQAPYQEPTPAVVKAEKSPPKPRKQPPRSEDDETDAKPW
jgi:hypothetical protein